MKRYSLSYRKRKRKTLSKTYSKKQKIEKTQEGGGYEEEVYFVKFPEGTIIKRDEFAKLEDFVKDYTTFSEEDNCVRDSPIATLQQLRNIKLIRENPNQHTQNADGTISSAECSSFGYVRKNSTAELEDGVYSLKSISDPYGVNWNTVNINSSGLVRSDVAATGVWCFGIKPPEGYDDNIQAYNNSFYSKNDFPDVCEINIGTNEYEATAIEVIDDKKIYFTDAKTKKLYIISSVIGFDSLEYRLNEYRSDATFENAKSLKMDSDGYIYVCDNDKIKWIPPNTSEAIGIAGTNLNNLKSLELDIEENILFTQNNKIGDISWNTDNTPKLEYLVRDTANLNDPNEIHIHKENTIFYNCLYIADQSKHTIFFIPETSGRYYEQQMDGGKMYAIAGNGSAGFNSFEHDGRIATSGQLNSPTSVTTDSKGRVYIADTGNHRIRMIDLDGTLKTIAGNAKNYDYTHNGSDTFGAGKCRDLHFIDAFNNSEWIEGMWNANKGICELSRRYNGTLSQFPQKTPESSSAENVWLESPTSLKMTEFEDDNGEKRKFLYFIANKKINRLEINEPAGALQNVPLPANRLQLNPKPATDLINYNETIPSYSISLFQDLLYSCGDQYEENEFHKPEMKNLLKPKNISMDYANNIYYTIGNAVMCKEADVPEQEAYVIAGDYRIYKYRDKSIIFSDSTYLGNGFQATEAELGEPVSVAVNSKGEVFISDKYNHCIRKIVNPVSLLDSENFSDLNTISTYAGVAGKQCYLDPIGGLKRVQTDGTVTSDYENIPATEAMLNEPHGICFDEDDNLFIADAGNHMIRMVAAKDYPLPLGASGGLAEDIHADVKILKYNIYGIRTEIKANHIYTIAGINRNLPEKAPEPYNSGTECAEITTDTKPPEASPETETTPALPETETTPALPETETTPALPGITEEPPAAGIYEINPTNAQEIRTTKGGTGIVNLGANARWIALNYPTSVFVDKNKHDNKAFYNVFIADTNNHLVRMVTYQGRIVNVAGCNKARYVNEDFKGLYSATINEKTVQFNQGDYAKATDSTLWYPNSVKLDICGNLIIAEKRNSRIRRVTRGGYETNTPIDAGIPEKTNFYNTGYIYTIAGNQDTLGFKNWGVPVAEGILTLAKLGWYNRANSTEIGLELPESFTYFQSRNRVIPPAQFDVVQNVKTGKDTTFCRADIDYFEYPSYTAGQTEIGASDNYYGKCLPGFENAVTPLAVAVSIPAAIQISAALIVAGAAGVMPLAALCAVMLTPLLIIIGDQITCRKKTNITGAKIDGLEVSSDGHAGIYNVSTYGESMMMHIMGGWIAANQYVKDSDAPNQRDKYYGNKDKAKKPTGFAGKIDGKDTNEIVYYNKPDNRNSVVVSIEDTKKWEFSKLAETTMIGKTYNNEYISDEKKDDYLHLFFGYYYCDYVKPNEKCIDYESGKLILKPENSIPKEPLLTCGGHMSEADRFLKRAEFFKEEEDDDVDMAEAFLKGGQTIPAPVSDRQIYLSEKGQIVTRIEYNIQMADTNNFKTRPFYNSQSDLSEYIDTLTNLYKNTMGSDYPGTKTEVGNAPAPVNSTESNNETNLSAEQISLLNPKRYIFTNQGEISTFPIELQIAKKIVGNRNATEEPAEGTAMAIEKFLKGEKVDDNNINLCRKEDLNTPTTEAITIEGSSVRFNCEGDFRTNFRNNNEEFERTAGEDYFSFKARMSSKELTQPSQPIGIRAKTYGAKNSNVPNVKSVFIDKEINGYSILLAIVQDDDGYSSIRRIQYNMKTSDGNRYLPEDEQHIQILNNEEKSYWNYRCGDVTKGPELMPDFATSNNGDSLEVDDKWLSQVSLGSISDITKCPVTGNYYVCDPEKGVVFAIIKDTRTQQYYTQIIAGKIDGTHRRAGDGSLSYNPVVSCESEENYYYSGSRLSNPTGIVVDSKGNAIIADTGHRVIRVVMNERVTCVGDDTPTKKYYNLTNLLEFNIYTLAGSGKPLDEKVNNMPYAFEDNMAATKARFTKPEAITLDNKEDLYISDTEERGNGYIYKVTKDSGKIEVYVGKRVISTEFQTGGAVDSVNIYDFVNYNKNPLRRTDCYISGVVDMCFNYSDDININHLYILQNTTKIDNGMELQGYNVLFVPSKNISGTMYGIKDMMKDYVYVLAGNGASGSYSPVNNYDCKYAVEGNLVNPTSIQVDSDNNIYICDSGANQVRIVNTKGLMFNAVESNVDDTVEEKILNQYPKDAVELDTFNKDYNDQNNGANIKKLIIDKTWDGLHVLSYNNNICVAYKNSVGNFEIEYFLPVRRSIQGKYDALCVDSDGEYMYFGLTDKKIEKRYNDYIGDTVNIPKRLDGGTLEGEILSIAVGEVETNVTDVFYLEKNRTNYLIRRIHRNTNTILINSPTKINCISFIKNFNNFERRLMYGDDTGIYSVSMNLTNQNTGQTFDFTDKIKPVYDIEYHENQILYLATGSNISCINLNSSDKEPKLVVTGSIKTLAFDSYYNLYYALVTNNGPKIYRKERTAYIDYKLNKPTGIILNADEDLYVSDSDNYRIVQLKYEGHAKKGFRDLEIPRFIKLQQHSVKGGTSLVSSPAPAIFENNYFGISEQPNIFNTAIPQLPTSFDIDICGNIFYSDFISGCIYKNTTKILGNNPSPILSKEEEFTPINAASQNLFQGITSFLFDNTNRGIQYILDNKNSVLYEYNTSNASKYKIKPIVTGVIINDYKVKLNQPWAVVKDTVKNQLYISDTFNSKIIGYDLSDNTTYNLIAPHEQFYPSAMAILNNTLYFVDTGTKSVKKIQLTQSVKTLYDSENIKLVTDKLSIPISIAVDSDGTIYVGDLGLKQVLSIDNECNTIKVIAGNGTDDGDNSIVSPIHLKIHGDKLYVLDSYKNKIYKLSKPASTVSDTISLPLTNPTDIININKKLYIKDDNTLYRLDYFNKINNKRLTNITNFSKDTSNDLYFSASNLISKIDMCSLQDSIFYKADSAIELFTIGSGSNIYYKQSDTFKTNFNLNSIALSNASAITYGSSSIFIGTSEGPYSKIKKYTDLLEGETRFGGINAPPPSVSTMNFGPVTNVRFSYSGKFRTIKWSEPNTSGIEGNFIYYVYIWDKNANYQSSFSKSFLQTTQTPQLWNVEASFAERFEPFIYRIDYTFTPISGNPIINFYGTPTWSSMLTNVPRLYGIDNLSDPSPIPSPLPLIDSNNIANISLNNIGGLTFFDNHLYVSDKGNNCIYKVNMNGKYDIIAGKRDFIPTSSPLPEDGKLATEVRLNAPTRITVDASGNVFFINSGTSTVHLIKDKFIYTVCGDTTLRNSINNILNLPNPVYNGRYINTGYLFCSAEGTFNVYYDNINSRDFKTGAYLPLKHREDEFFYINNNSRVDISPGANMINQKMPNNDSVTTDIQLDSNINYLQNLDYSNKHEYKYTQVNLGVTFNYNNIVYSLIYDGTGNEFNNQDILIIPRRINPRKCYFIEILQNDTYITKIDQTVNNDIFTKNDSLFTLNINNSNYNVNFDSLNGIQSNRDNLLAETDQNAPNDLNLYYTEYIKLPSPPPAPSPAPQPSPSPVPSPAPSPSPSPSVSPSPAAITGLTAPNIIQPGEVLSFNSIKISWLIDDDDLDGKKYTYRYKENNFSNSYYFTIDDNTIDYTGLTLAPRKLSYTIQGLVNNTEYNIRLIRQLDFESSIPAVYSTLTTRSIIKQNKITLNRITNITTTSIQLNWSTVTAPSGTTFTITTPMFYYINVNNISSSNQATFMIRDNSRINSNDLISSYWVSASDFSDLNFEFRAPNIYSFRIALTTTPSASFNFSNSDIGDFSDPQNASLVSPAPGPAPPSVDAVIYRTRFILSHIYFRTNSPYDLTPFPGSNRFNKTTINPSGGIGGPVTNIHSSNFHYNQSNDSGFPFLVNENNQPSPSNVIYYHSNKANVRNNIEKFLIINDILNATPVYGYFSNYDTTDTNYGTVTGSLINETTTYYFIGKIAQIYRISGTDNTIIPSIIQTQIDTPPLRLWTNLSNNSILIGVFSPLSANPPAPAPAASGGMIGGQIQTYNLYKDNNSDSETYFIVDPETKMRYNVSYDDNLIFTAISDSSLQGTVQLYDKTREKLLESPKTVDEFKQEVDAIQTYLEENNQLEEELNKNVYESIFVKLPNPEFEKPDIVDYKKAPTQPSFGRVESRRDADYNTTITVRWSSSEATKTTEIYLKKNGSYVNVTPTASNLTGNSGFITYFFPRIGDDKMDSYVLYVTMANSVGTSLNTQTFQVYGKKI